MSNIFVFINIVDGLNICKLMFMYEGVSLMFVWNDGSIMCEKIGLYCIFVECFLFFELWIMMLYWEKFVKFLVIFGFKMLILMLNLK